MVQSLTEYTKTLMMEVDIGDSTKRTKHLLNNLKKFEKDTQVSRKGISSIDFGD